MPKPAPYTFPHRSRAAIVEYLTERRARSYNYQTYRFAWCVKVHSARFDGDALRKHIPGLNPALDSAWDSYVESPGDGLFWQWCEDAGRDISAGEWSSYPGDDQGEWEFSFAGRSSGWIVLEKWRGRDMRSPDAFDLMDSDAWPWADLVAFYRGIRTADSDFTPAKAAANVEYYAADHREQWEAEIKAERDAQAKALADEIAESRPDLAPVWLGQALAKRLQDLTPTP